MWDDVGMGRTKKSLDDALARIPSLREEFWKTVSVSGSGEDFNQTLERGVNYRVRVSVQDDRFITYLNGQIIGDITDNRLRRGGVGFFADDSNRSCAASPTQPAGRARRIRRWDLLK